MISMNWKKMSDEIGDLVNSYQALPGYLGKKHVVASLKRSIVKSGGVRQLRQNTPPSGLKRGRKAKGQQRRGSTGELRRAVITKGRWIGTTKAGWGVAGLGYRFRKSSGNDDPGSSRKAIWHEFGTSRMKAVGMMQKTFEAIRGQVASTLAEELRKGLENAANELGKNPGMSKRGMAAGLGPRF